MVILGSTALLAVAVVVAVLLVQHVGHAAGQAVAAGPTGVGYAPPVAGTSGDSFLGNTNPQDTAVPTTTTDPQTAPTTPTDEASAEAALAQQVAADHAQVEQLVGVWVPELSAKDLGLVTNGITYDYQQIWADYQQQAASHPGALLLESGDYSSFKLGGYWITVVPQVFSNAAGANSWCASQNIDANDCFAKRLSHTDSYQGNTVTRN